MSVTWRNMPSTGGSGGRGCFKVRCLRQRLPACVKDHGYAALRVGNSMTMSEPCRHPMLSSLSIFTECANDQA